MNWWIFVQTMTASFALSTDWIFQPCRRRLKMSSLTGVLCLHCVWLILQTVCFYTKFEQKWTCWHNVNKDSQSSELTWSPLHTQLCNLDNLFQVKACHLCDLRRLSCEVTGRYLNSKIKEKWPFYTTRSYVKKDWEFFLIFFPCRPCWPWTPDGRWTSRC